MNEVRRLLIVDDEETLTFSLYQTFIASPMACEVITAATGEEALQRFREQAFDLIITDISMPGLSGLELLSRVKQQRPQTRVIIITAYGSSDKEEEARQLGADRYVEKPFDLKELRQIVTKMLE